MKHIILKISFCFSVIFTIAQNKTVTTEVTYKLDFNLNSVSEKLSNKYNSKQLELLQNNYNNYNSLSYKLIFNSKESIFFLVDSVVGVLKDYDESYLEKQKIIKTQSKKKYYRNLEKNQLVYSTEISGEPLLITSKHDVLEWKLTNIQMQIGNYNCYKAILVKGQELLGYKKGLAIIAWYTPTIPVPFGPINFGALPGLILQLEVGPKTYYVDKINFNKQYTITPLSKGRLMTIEQYSHFLNSFFDDNFGK